MASRLDADEGNLFDFLCECGDLACSRFVQMTVAEYHASERGLVVGHPVELPEPGEEDGVMPAEMQRAEG